ncbi:MAG: hypothetical protein U7126_08495 [Microcoleus sp.]
MGSWSVLAVSNINSDATGLDMIRMKRGNDIIFISSYEKLSA